MTNNQAEGRHYIDYDPNAGYPAGSTLFYECLKCGFVMPSLPPSSVNCSCWNVGIDVGYGRVSVRDHNLMRIFAMAVPEK
jgi:hypothetical protein